MLDAALSIALGLGIYAVMVTIVVAGAYAILRYLDRKGKLKL